jgi:glycosyltransferase involved in cell wall biosynthesis
VTNYWLNGKIRNLRTDTDMHILFIAPQPFYEDRGTPIAIYDTIVALTELGFEVDLATFPLGSDINLNGVRVLRTANPLRYRSIPVGFSFRKIVLDICLLMSVLRLVNRNHYDCIHGVEEGAVLALICKVLSGMPVIYDMQSSLPEQLKEVWWLRTGPGRWLSLLGERWLIRAVDYIISSIGLAGHVHSIEPRKPVLECSFDGCDPRARDENLAKSLGTFGRPTVVYTGNFAPYQGLEHLIEAAALVRVEIPEVIFIIVGGTVSEIIRFSALLAKCKLGNNVKLHHHRLRQEIPDFMALADVLVLPRFSGENAPLKIYDYLKSGKPIVATDIPAHRALLSKETAILVEPNPRGLSDGILLAIRDTAYSKKVASAARAFSRKQAMKPLKDCIAEAYRCATGEWPQQ